MPNTSKLFLIFLLGISLLQSACNKEETPSESVFTFEDEMALGEKLHYALQNDNNRFDVLELDDYTLVNSFMTKAKISLTGSEALQNKEVFDWQINIINDPRHNSFALPGGYIYIFSGLMKDRIHDGAACYGIIAHEIAIADEGLVTQKLKDGYSLALLLDVALGNNEDAALDLVDYILNEPYSPQDSQVADELAVELLCTDDISIPNFADFVNSETNDAPSDWLQTHPNYMNRSTTLVDLSTGLNCANSVELLNSYREMVVSF